MQSNAYRQYLAIGNITRKAIEGFLPIGESKAGAWVAGAIGPLNKTLNLSHPM